MPIKDLPKLNLLESSDHYRLAKKISVGLALIFLAFLPPGIYSIDGNAMLALAESLVTHHSFAVPQGLGAPGIGGQIYSNWYPLLSLLAVPLVFVAHVISGHVHLPFHYLAAMCALVVEPCLAAATAGVVALLALRLGATARAAWLAAISFAVSSIALAYARSFMAEPLLGLLIALSLYFAFTKNPREIVICAAVTALAVLAKPTGVLVGPILSAYLITKDIRWRLAILPGFGALLGLVVYVLYNIMRFGNPLRFGPPLVFHLSVFPSGFAGLLFSPGWGLVWYCPAVVLAAVGCRSVDRAKRPEVATILLVFVAFLVLHSCYKFWDAGWAWGPRYLLPTLPGVYALTGLLRGNGRKALVALSILGFLVNAPTLFSYYERYYAELNDTGVGFGEVTWSFSRAPFVHAWPAAIREAQDASTHDVRELFAQRGDPAQRIDDSRALRVVALWWWALPIAGIPRWVGVGLSAVLIAAGGAILLRSLPASDTSPLIGAVWKSEQISSAA